MRVGIFAASGSGTSPGPRRTAARLGEVLARAGVGIVYGGGRVGLMGELADRALACGGSVIGVMPRPLVAAELAHPDLEQLHVVDSMHDRKSLIADHADAFCALPGGPGTLEELFEVWTWQQLGLHAKPVAICDQGAYWTTLRSALTEQAAAGFLRPVDLRSLLVCDPDDLLPQLDTWLPPPPKWSTTADPVIDSVGLVLVVDGRLLVVRSRGSDAFFLPGGKPEEGEDARTALARELDEEIGLRLQPGQLHYERVVEDVAYPRAARSSAIPPGRVRMRCFTTLAVPPGWVPRCGREIAQHAWVARDEARRVAPAVAQVLSIIEDLHPRRR